MEVHGEVEGMLGEGKEDREGGKVCLAHTHNTHAASERSRRAEP